MELVPYFELLFLLLIGQAFAHRLFGQLTTTPTADALDYALLSALPVYVVTSSLALSLADFAVVLLLRYLYGCRLMDESITRWIAACAKVLWVVLLFMEIPILLE